MYSLIENSEKFDMSNTNDATKTAFNATIPVLIPSYLGP